MRRLRLSLAAKLVAILALGAACGGEGGDRDSRRVSHRAPTALADGGEASEDTGGDDLLDGVTPSDVASTDTPLMDTAPADTWTPPPPEPPPVPAIGADVLAELQAAMTGASEASALSGRSFGGLVIDADTGLVVFDDASDARMIPASNTKIFTTAAALALLGEDHRMVTRAIALTPPDGSGAVAGSLHVHGAHDFTMSSWYFDDPRAPFDLLARRLYDAGLRRVEGDLELWGAWCYEGYHFGTYSPAAHRARAQQALGEALAAAGIAVVGQVVGHATMDVPEGQELARIASPPLWVAIWAINRKSHNEMADALLRHLGWVAGGTSDYATGAAQVVGWLESVGIDASGVVMGDGSGLEVANRFSARQMVELYRVMGQRPEGPAWRSSLSVAGAGGPGSVGDDGAAIVTENIAPYNGTLAWRMTGADTAGRVLGKSGTNAGITTSGLLRSRYDGRRYLFALLMNDISQGQYPAAREAQDAIVAAAARDHLGLGRPAAPVLQAVTGRADGAVVVRWEPAPGIVGLDGADGYFVWTSDDGRVFDPAARVFTLGTTWTAADRGPGEAVYVRVSAVSAAGQSDPSDVYAARVDAGAARVLIVDGNDRWQAQPANENPSGAPHAFVERYAAALNGVAFDSCANEAVTAGAVNLSAYDAVLWAVGEESWGDETFSSAEQALVASYLGGGGRALVSGAEIGWDLDPSGFSGATAADNAFLETWLKTGYAGDDAGVFEAEPVAGGPFEGLPRLGFCTPGRMFVAYPEQLAPLGGAEPALEYASDRGWAAVAYAGADYRLIHLGFPFASIDGAAERAALMDHVLTFLGL